MGIISCFPGGGGVQSDWNQNDETAPDYVKNRPFYTGDPVETILVEESTVSFSEGRNGKYQGELSSTFSATVGETYKVSWDGAAYECACVNINGATIIGNLSITGEGSDTGEPFVMIIANGEGIQIVTADTSASHTISISGYAESVVKIDQKYLPVASETEPGIISITPLSNAILQQVGNEYFSEINTQVSGYGNAAQIKEYANINNSHGIFSPGKLEGAVLSCYDTANEHITFVLSGGKNIECWKFSQGSTTMERLWGISEDGVVISSSTSGSTKKFRITVDDSGSLTITNEQEGTSSICATPSDISTAVSDHDSNASAHSEQFDKKQNVPTQLTALPDSGTALTANTLYNVDATVDTYSFTPPVGNSWAHGIFATGTTPNITFTGKIIGKLPTFAASKQYEFDVYNGAWIVQEVVTQ